MNMFRISWVWWARGVLSIVALVVLTVEVCWFVGKFLE